MGVRSCLRVVVQNMLIQSDLTLGISNFPHTLHISHLHDQSEMELVLPEDPRDVERQQACASSKNSFYERPFGFECCRAKHDHPIRPITHLHVFSHIPHHRDQYWIQIGLQELSRNHKRSQAGARSAYLFPWAYVRV